MSIGQDDAAPSITITCMEADIEDCRQGENSKILFVLCFIIVVSKVPVICFQCRGILLSFVTLFIFSCRLISKYFPPNLFCANNTG